MKSNLTDFKKLEGAYFLTSKNIIRLRKIDKSYCQENIVYNPIFEYIPSLMRELKENPNRFLLGKIFNSDEFKWEKPYN